jgi:hypothetical protein
MIPDDRIAANRARHVRILGICWVAYGIVRLGAAVWLALFTNTATMMFGALLNRVPDPFSMMSMFHFLYGFLVVLSVAIGVLGIMAGLGLLAGARSGRRLAIVAAFLSLSSVPLGTTLGIYTLIVLLNAPPQQSPAVVPGVSISDMKRQPLAM